MIVGHLGSVRVCKDCSTQTGAKTVPISDEDAGKYDSISRGDEGLTVKGIGQALANFGTGGASLSNLSDAVQATRLLLVLRAAHISDKVRCRCNLYTEVQGEICGCPSAVREDGLHMCWRCSFLEVVTGTDATFSKLDAPPLPPLASTTAGGSGGVSPPLVPVSEAESDLLKPKSRFNLTSGKSFKGNSKPKSPKGNNDGQLKPKSPKKSVSMNLPTPSTQDSDAEAVERLGSILARALVSDSSLCSSKLYTVEGGACGRPAALDPQTRQPTELCWQCKRVEVNLHIYILVTINNHTSHTCVSTLSLSHYRLTHVTRLCVHRKLLVAMQVVGGMGVD